MKTLFHALLVVAMALVLSGAIENSSNAYRIVGQYIAIEPDTTEDVDPATSGQTSSADMSNATILITYEVENDEGETETVELASGSFVDGKIFFEGEIDEPTEIKISVPELADQRVWLYTMIYPGGSDISFAFVDKLVNDKNTIDRIALVGTSRRAQNSDQKFTISGDLNSFAEDLTQAHVLIREIGDIGQGDRALNSGNMLPLNGKFLFEGETREPALVEISVSSVKGSEVLFASKVHAVVEPGAEISVHAQGEQDELVAVSGSGRHSKLIESWRQSQEYMETREKFVLTEAEYSEKNAALWDAVNAAIAELNEYIQDDTHEHLAHERKLEEIRTSTLQTIAKNAEDPLDSLLAMELGAFQPTAENRSEAFEIYDKLAEELEEEIVERRVVPARKKLISFIDAEENDADLVEGETVPDFTLSDLNGEEIVLYDVLAENEYVLVEFWASWCGPCIQSFPALKTLHADYNANGFEIVSVSIDTDSYYWEQESEAQELPWIDVGEMDGWNGETATAYGVQFVPKGYLVDSTGLILEKDLNPGELGEFLTEKLGTKD